MSRWRCCTTVFFSNVSKIDTIISNGGPLSREEPLYPRTDCEEYLRPPENKSKYFL